MFRIRGAPMLIISVGPAGPLQQSLSQLAELLPWPVVTLEAIAELKHDGELLEPPPSAAGAARLRGDVWQTIRVYTRRTADVDGHAHYSELTRRLRWAGAGATTILGDWGFSSDEPPYGDRLGRVASRRPTYTVYNDRPQRVAEVWPVIGEVTAAHGIVTSLIVPGYRERAGDTVHVSLDLGSRSQPALNRAASSEPPVASPAL
jgi:PII-like signaling protein